MSLYPALVRPMLFRLSADRAHELGRLALRCPWVWKLLGASSRLDDPRLSVNVGGLHLRNPVGLAAGLDKDADLLSGLCHLGFGYIVVGSITSQPRFGNPFPRLVRYPERLSIANSMGLPNKGLDQAVQRLRRRPRPSCPIIAMLSGSSSEELVSAAKAVEPFVDAVQVGLGCPNTTEAERLEGLRVFTQLVEGLVAGQSRPVFVKLPPHYSDTERSTVNSMLEIAEGAKANGVTLSGSRQVVEPGLGMGRGSLAGKDTFDDALRIVDDVAERVGDRMAIRVSGGVFSGQDAFRMLQAGASAVEVYSAFIYRGWNVAGLINRELAAMLDREQAPTLSHLKKLSETIPVSR